jgi:hypothetical protein
MKSSGPLPHTQVAEIDSIADVAVDADAATGAFMALAERGL